MTIYLGRKSNSYLYDESAPFPCNIIGHKVIHVMVDTKMVKKKYQKKLENTFYCKRCKHYLTDGLNLSFIGRHTSKFRRNAWLRKIEKEHQKN